MQKILYLVGKPYPHAASIEKIRSLGYGLGLFLDVDATIKHPEHYDRIVRLDFSSLDAIAGQLQDVPDIQVDGLMCLYENYILAKAEIGRFFDLPVMSLDSARKCTDKYLMRSAFMAADPAITPNYALIHDETELLAFAAGRKFPLMLKPANLVKSLLVMRCDDQQELLRNYRYASGAIAGLYDTYNIYDREPQIIVEEYIVGQSCSVAAMVDSQGTPHFCEGIVALATAQDHGVNDTYLYERSLPADFSADLQQKIFDTARAGVRALGMTSSPAHIELIYNNDEVKLVEIGARTGGYRTRMYNHCYGIDLLAQEVRLALGEKPELAGQLQAYCGVYELFPETEGGFVGITGPVEQLEQQQFEVKATTGQIVGPARQGHKAAATVITVSSDQAGYERLRNIIGQLQVEVAA